MTFINKIAYLFCLFLIGAAAWGQEYNYTNYTVDEGLPSNSVYGAVQDQRGYLWVYTEKGISRFDGYEFKNYTVKEGLPVNDIWSISEDYTGRLWINCLSDKIYFIKNDSIKPFIFRSGKKGSNYRNFIEYQGEILTLSPRPKIYLKLIAGTDTLEMVDYAQRESCKDVHTYSRVITPRWNIIFLDSFVVIEDWTTNLLEYIPTKTAKNYGHEVFQPASIKGNVTYVICEHKGINFFNHKHQKHFLVDTAQFPYVSLANKFKVEFVADYFQVNTQEKLLVLDDTFKIVDQLDFADLSTNKKIANAMRDRDHNYWIGTANTGLYFLSQQSRNAQQLVPKGKRVEVINGMMGKVLVGTDKGELLQFEQEKYKDISYQSRKDWLRTIAFKNKDEFLVGYDFNMLFIKDGKVRSYKDFPPKPIDSDLFKKPEKRQFFEESISLKCSAYLPKEDAYLLGTGYGLFKMKIRDSLEVEMLNNYRITSILLVDDEIWFGSMKGLGRLDKELKTILPARKHPLLGKYVNSLARDSMGRVWAGTDGHGVYAFTKDTLFRLSIPNINAINTLFIDKKNRLWVGTNQGIILIRIDQKNPENSAIIRRLSPNDGLPTNEIRSLFVDDDDLLYVGTSKGMVKIDLNFKYHNSSPPRLYWDTILVDNKWRDINSLKQLKYYENKIDLSYTAISFKSHQNIEYEITTNNSVRIKKERTHPLENLPPGTYNISIRAKDIEGVYSEETLKLKIVIAPPWWRTYLAWTVWILSFIALVFLIILLRTRKIRKEEQEKRAISKKFAELELNALQSQMNPHFVFNSLGAIQFYINKNNVEKADEYLSQFAYLMRLFLESSKSKYVTLEQEIQLLELYVKIEQMRFPKKFHFELIVAEKINPHSVQIPSMLLQPFLENAINHGLFHKQENGKLSMHISEKKGKLHCLIEDDGIGRAAALEIKQKSNRNYISRGMQIVEDRISTLNQIENSNINITIEDLYAQGKACGTRVLVSLLIEE